MTTLTSTPVQSSTSTKATGNGIETPLPTQPEIVSNCDKFYFVQAKEQCDTIAARFGITLAKVLALNPSAGTNCGGLWAQAYACVGTIGEEVISTTSKSNSAVATSTIVSSSSTTSSGNGIATPQPTQPGMVANCNKFHWVADNVVCSQVISYQKITLADFVKWNPTVLSDCSGMWAQVNVCVGVISDGIPAVSSSTATPKPTSTTAAGNGVVTPQPTQPGMVSNCATFHWIAAGVTCSQVLSYEKISLADFVKWNPTVGSDCTGMKADVNVCVGIIKGTTPTTTTSAGNGVSTPLLTQAGMVTNCKKFHYAETGVNCSQITSYNNISLADFVKWNPGVGADCKNMQAKTYTCVGV